MDASQGVRVGEGAWVGTHTTVLDGVTVGKGAVIGANSLVSRSIPEMSVAYGSPAEVRRKRGRE
jgi:acetyltransferase-like isoleucine patch superfamily enzyme